ncbi:MAG: type VI secretion system tip protein VgrG [Oscillochloris sp.]|nr:type VI secretion system tip protein VgrG [Oscillochloris sp.]
MSYTQQHLHLTVTTPLGADKLLLSGFQGEELICGLFHLRLELLSEDKSLDFKQIVGQHATLSLGLGEGQPRLLDGVVTRFYQGGKDGRFTAYYADLRPWLWLLTQTSDSRIFQGMSIPAIIEQVCKDLGFSDLRSALTKSYEPREYCVQYQETAFAFVSRLMEDEGIFYFFDHAEGKHTLVLADSRDAHQACPGLSGPVRYQSALPGTSHADAVSFCTFEQQVVTGKYMLDDYNFEIPATDLANQLSGDAGDMRVYEYPGGYMKKDAGDKRAKIRLESHEWARTMLRGEGFCRAFIPGSSFTLSAHDRDEANQAYVLTRVVHQASQASYSNSFEAFPAATPFRPPRVTPRPLIPGTQTAFVVGKSGEEIWTDTYGRVKVQFHWDQQGKHDENSSCWIRGAQGWAGKAWGSIFIPRIGQEVVVSFLNGDPDRPLITGAVYNAEQTVPYALPGEQTKSTIKSNSSKGGGGFNELRIEDKKGEEQIFLHAQRNYEVVVLNDETRMVKQNRSATIEEGDETLTVSKGKRTIKVDAGDETHTVKGKRSVTVSDDEAHTDDANFTHKVTGNYELKVMGNLKIVVSGTIEISSGQSITQKAAQNITNQAGMNLESNAGQGLTNKAGMTLNNEAGMSLTSKGGVSQTVESGGVLTLQGALVKIN